MLNFSNYLLWAWLLCGSLAEDATSSVSPQSQCDSYCQSAMQPLLTQLQLQETIVNETQAIMDRMEAKLADIMAILTGTNISETTEVSSVKKPVPEDFQQIGSRFFYIENNYYQKWSVAAKSCLQMGGHLASIENQEELAAITAKLEKGYYYWLDTNDQALEGHFVSNNRTSFLKWEPGEPNDKNHSENCVALSDGLMFDANCEHSKYFICQADMGI